MVRNEAKFLMAIVINGLWISINKLGVLCEKPASIWAIFIVAAQLEQYGSVQAGRQLMAAPDTFRCAKRWLKSITKAVS